MPYWAKHLKCQQSKCQQSKCNSFLAIRGGSEYHYWAPVVFDSKMPTGPYSGGDQDLPCKQTACAPFGYFTAMGCS